MDNTLILRAVFVLKKKFKQEKLPLTQARALLMIDDL